MIVPVSGRAKQMQLAIEIDSDPIAGSVSVGAGAPQRFSGWIELVAVIESARRAASAGGEEKLGALSGVSSSAA